MKFFRKRKKKNADQFDQTRKNDNQVRINRKLVALHSPNSYEAERFRILKTKILFPPSGEQIRSIMITSAFRGVGKSFVSANLAVSIAQSIDQHVLLIDCDMRKSSIHKLFGYDDNIPGLSDYLMGSLPLSDFLLKTMIPKLTFLPSGSPPPNPAELISSNKMKILLKEVREQYDDRYVIIDAPPSRITAETSAIAGKIDAVILIAKYGKTPVESMAELIETIGKDKISSIIINQCNSAVDFWGRKKQYYGYGR